jgi:LacI family kdg operon repressor
VLIKELILSNNKKKFATISDVAKHAQVGKTSVSRYLNNEKDKLSDLIRDKISLAISDLDYRPNHSARMLKAGNSKLIGVVIADITNHYSIEVLQGIEQICRKEGYMLILCNTNNEKELQKKYLSLLEAHRVDGIIINALGMAQDHLDAFSKLECPFVLVDRGATGLGVDTVGLDNEAAVLKLCNHLLDKCYESILVVTQQLDNDTRRVRVEAIQHFVEQVPHLTCQVVEIDINDDRLTEVIDEFIKTNRGLKKAIFSTNGMATMAAAQALKKLDLHLGSQIGLVNIDDPEWAQLVDGGITVMRQPTEEIGQTACKRLIARIQGDNQPALDIKLTAKLIVRSSA